MSSIFLGKPLHWIAVVAAAAILYGVGGEKLHTSAFNLYTMIVIVITVALVVLVVATSEPGERVTRDPIEEPDEDR